MGLLQWLASFGGRGNDGERKTETPSPTPSAVASAAGEKIGNLDLPKALDAHAKWRERLEGILNGTNQERPEVGTVSVDHLCDLGKWIHGEGKQYSTGAYTKEYAELVSAHRQFHLNAGEVLLRFNADNIASATEYLRKEFRQGSDRVQLALVRLYAKIQGG